MPVPSVGLGEHSKSARQFIVRGRRRPGVSTCGIARGSLWPSRLEFRTLSRIREQVIKGPTGAVSFGSETCGAASCPSWEPRRGLQAARCAETADLDWPKPAVIRRRVGRPDGQRDRSGGQASGGPARLGRRDHFETPHDGTRRCLPRRQPRSICASDRALRRPRTRALFWDRAAWAGSPGHAHGVRRSLRSFFLRKSGPDALLTSSEELQERLSASRVKSRWRC